MKTLRAEIGAPAEAASPRPARFRWRWSWVARTLAGAAALAVIVGVATGRIDAEAAGAHAQRLNGGVAFGLLVALPLLGFPASVLHVAAGMRFGAGLGLALVSASILLQLVLSYGIARRWGSRLQRRLAPVRRRLPAGSHASVSIFAVLLPGAPYAAINYVLPLIGVRLRVFLLCCWPLHTLRSTVTVLLGDQADELTPARLTALGGYALVLLTSSWFVYRRLKRRLADPRAAAGDQTRSG